MKQVRSRETASGVDTCMKVVDATIRLLDDKGLDDLSVGAICSNAGISRTTFYYHFDDKFDIVQWHYDHVARQNLFETGRTLTWFQAHYRNTFEVLKKKELYLAAFKLRGYQSLFAYAKRQRIDTLKATITEYKNEALDHELEFQIYALAEAEVASMSRWFKEGMPFDLETLCRYLEGIVPLRLHDLLAEPVNPRLY